MTPNKRKLRGLESISRLLKLVFLSAYIIGEKPLSCLLVAPVSSGKTISIKQFKNNENLLISTDSTAFGLLKNHQTALKERKIRHIIIPDLLNAMARKKQTQDQLILFINSSSEDGIFPSATYGLQIPDFIPPFGWVMCLTNNGYKRKERFLKEIGFISRFCVLKYKYSLEQVQAILQDIVDEINVEIPDIRIKTSKRGKKIQGNPKIFKELTVFSKVLCRESDSEILRMQKKLQTLAKASALERGDNRVKQIDFDIIKEFMPFIQ